MDIRSFRDVENLLFERCKGLYPDRELHVMALMIAGQVTGRSRTELLINREEMFTKEEGERIKEKVERLAGNEPIQYVLGEAEFYGLKLKVEPGVLIPRGETEELVEWVLKEQGERRKEKGGRVLDIGCGSGAIAIALAKHLPHAEIWAADISPKALDITHQNALNNQVDINLLQFDILNPHPLFTSSPYPLIPSSPHALMPSCPYALIISNPPYIPEGERGSMALHVAGQEPDLALFVPDSDPLIFYRAIAQYAQNHLEPDGEVYVEIHDRFGREVAELFGTFFSKVQLRQDIHGKDRMIRAFNG